FRVFVTHGCGLETGGSVRIGEEAATLPGFTDGGAGGCVVDGKAPEMFARPRPLRFGGLLCLAGHELSHPIPVTLEHVEQEALEVAAPPDVHAWRTRRLAPGH